MQDDELQNEPWALQRAHATAVALTDMPKPLLPWVAGFVALAGAITGGTALYGVFHFAPWTYGLVLFSVGLLGAAGLLIAAMGLDASRRARRTQPLPLVAATACLAAAVGAFHLGEYGLARMSFNYYSSGKWWEPYDSVITNAPPELMQSHEHTNEVDTLINRCWVRDREARAYSFQRDCFLQDIPQAATSLKLWEAAVHAERMLKENPHDAELKALAQLYIVPALREYWRRSVAQHRAALLTASVLRGMWHGMPLQFAPIGSPTHEKELRQLIRDVGGLAAEEGSTPPT